MNNLNYLHHPSGYRTTTKKHTHKYTQLHIFPNISQYIFKKFEWCSLKDGLGYIINFLQENLRLNVFAYLYYC